MLTPPPTPAIGYWNSAGDLVIPAEYEPTSMTLFGEPVTLFKSREHTEYEFAVYMSIMSFGESGQASTILTGVYKGVYKAPSVSPPGPRRRCPGRLGTEY